MSQVRQLRHVGRPTNCLRFGVAGYKNVHPDQAYAPYGQATWTPPIFGDTLSVAAGIRFTKWQGRMTKIVCGIVTAK